jgi:hypothetical protein
VAGVEGVQEGQSRVTVPVLFYGFQRVPDVRVVERDQGWNGWFVDSALPLINAGFRDHHLHNPFGLHDVAGRDRKMHIDQFQLSYCDPSLRWLANRSSFAQAVSDVHDRHGTVRAYVGSPLVVDRSPQDTFLPRCSARAKMLSSQIRLLRSLGLCGSRPRSGCRCWDPVIGFHLAPLVEASVDAIGFDSSADFYPGDCMDRLVRTLVGRGIEVIIEPWPRRDREYPPVNWIIREILYERITYAPHHDEAPRASVRGRIYRIVPADTAAGNDELSQINQIRVDHGQQPFHTVREVQQAVMDDGDTPLVRARDISAPEIA